jgi:adenylate kinase
MLSRLVLLGPPGAGKGTQSPLIKEHLKVPTIATGAIFREAMANDRAIGKEIAQFVNAGLLVPDQLTNAIVVKRLKHPDCTHGFILDGYPRSLNQAKALDAYLKKIAQPLEKVLYFKVDPAVVVERMGLRRVCAQCGTSYNLVSHPSKVEGVCDVCGGELIMRTDDAPEAIRKRLQVYSETTSPLLAYYEKKGILSMVDASQSVEAITRQLAKYCGMKVL